MDYKRALSDLAEVRERLAQVQRFEGYSGPAAVLSGVVAFVAGGVQQQIAPLPSSPPGFHAYVTIWMSCLATAILLNYGAVAVWVLKHRAPGEQSRFRSAALSIAPSVVLGGALSWALIDHAAYALLPGTWFAFYAIGLFASRSAIPDAALAVSCAFALLGVLFLVTPLSSIALAWWVMPLGFGFGQIAIGYFVWRDRSR
ncbi:MAG: hypothetical protein JO092_03690 [Candidatus Eremiobacteraeota bacterium]|nr:hypothetical protein [Candidatus Eremiobacteraeota bacterium]